MLETPFPTEPLITALLLTQHKMISWLSKHVKSDQKKAAGGYNIPSSDGWVGPTRWGRSRLLQVQDAYQNVSRESSAKLF